jgi:hypothetical protein
MMFLFFPASPYSAWRMNRSHFHRYRPTMMPMALSFVAMNEITISSTIQAVCAGCFIEWDAFAFVAFYTHLLLSRFEKAV